MGKEEEGEVPDPSKRRFVKFSGKAGAALALAYLGNKVPRVFAEPASNFSIEFLGSPEFLNRLSSIEKGLTGLGISEPPPQLQLLQEASTNLQIGRFNHKTVEEAEGWLTGEVSEKRRSAVGRLDRDRGPENPSLEETVIDTIADALLGNKRRLFLGEVNLIPATEYHGVVATVDAEKDKLSWQAGPSPSLGRITRPGLEGMIDGLVLHEFTHLINPLAPENTDDAISFPVSSVLDYYQTLGTIFDSNFDDVWALLTNQKEGRLIWSGFTSPDFQFEKMGMWLLDFGSKRNWNKVLGEEITKVFLGYCNELGVDLDKNPDVRLMGLALWRANRELVKKGERLKEERVSSDLNAFSWALAGELTAQSLEVEWRDYQPLKKERRPFVELGMSMWKTIAGIGGVEEAKERVLLSVTPVLIGHVDEKAYQAFQNRFVFGKKVESSSLAFGKPLSPEQQELIDCLRYILQAGESFSRLNQRRLRLIFSQKQG